MGGGSAALRVGTRGGHVGGASGAGRTHPTWAVAEFPTGGDLGLLVGVTAAHGTYLTAKVQGDESQDPDPDLTPTGLNELSELTGAARHTGGFARPPGG